MPNWNDLIIELNDIITANKDPNPGPAYDTLRSKYLKKLSELTGRNVIAYYSGFLKDNNYENLDINDNDMTGFMVVSEDLDPSKGLDLILHTPGGSPTATEGIVKYLHGVFGNDIRVIVPQMAMSAGTMLACSSKEIIMGLHSCLGPIDPQVNRIPAFSVIQEHEAARKELDDNNKNVTYWQIQLGKYPPAYYYFVKDAIALSDKLVGEWLQDYMFFDKSKKEAKKAASSVLKVLNSNNQSHSRHFSIDDCRKMGLKVISLEDDKKLRDAVLSVHYTYLITIDGTYSAKFIENQLDGRYITNCYISGR